MMKKVFLVLTAALGLTMSAKADLGDTYAESCKQFGAEGVVSREDHSMCWIVRDLNGVSSWTVAEWFVKNQCVAIVCESLGNDILESAIWNTLQRNSLSTHVWIEYSRHDNQRDFTTTDQKLFGTERVVNGHVIIRVAYASWMKVHKMFKTTSADSESAPIEDSI